jgi:hypothetical protein
MRMNERLTNRTYDRALDVFMPPIGQVIVLENFKDERRHLAAIEAHIARLTDKHHVAGAHDIRANHPERPFAR